MSQIVIDPQRLAKITTLSRGGHPPPTGEEFCGCFMEAEAWITHRPWSDHPPEDCPVISALIRAWQDNLPDAKRTVLLRPLQGRVAGTKASPEVERRRAIMVSDFVIRVDAPAWLRLAGLEAEAAALESLPEITDFETTPPLRIAMEAAERAATAARRA